ncbi:MAG: 50S ribosomal protein L29 [Patescibacteria group bacterium]
MKDKTISELRIELAKAILALSSRKEKNTNLVKKIRRQIAQNLTPNV